MNSMHDKRSGFQSGQIGLVVLLITAVLLTVGLGSISQSVIETKTARQESETNQALNAAEQGVEAALKQNLATTPAQNITGLPEGFSGQYQVDEKAVYEGLVLNGKTAPISLSGGTATGIHISWPKTGNCQKDVGIIVSLITAGGVRRYAYGPDACAASRNDGFTVATETGDVYEADVVTAGVDSARIKVVYADTILTVAGINGSLPVQSYVVTSTATDTSGGSRTVEVNKTLASTASVFDYVLFAGQGDMVHSEP